MRTFPQSVLRWIEGLTQDLRYGARHLRRAPGLVAVSVLSLGLGIGLNLTLYAGVTTIFRHQPTMTDPASVVGIEPGNGRQFSYQNYRDLRDSGSFAGVVGFRMSAMNRRVGDQLERLSVLVATDNFFDALGIRTRLGRTFAAGEAGPERSPRVIVLDHPYWNARFGADPDAIGQTMMLDGELFTVIGVLPEDYRSVTGFMAPSAVVPVSALTLPTLNDRGSPTLSILARLPPAGTRQHARAAVAAFGAELESRFPEINEGMSRPAQVFPADAMQFRGTPVGFRLFPIVLLVLFGLVLLIASVNVAGLLLARAVSRQHELTIRSALGASRVRVIQTLLSESFLLSLLGAAAGLALTSVLSRSDFLDTMRPLQRVFTPDRQLIAPGLVLVALTTILCGVAPALQSSKVNLLTGLRKGASGATSRINLRSAFIVGQVALSLTLLVVSSLCLRSQMRIVDIDLGFDLDHGVVTRFNVEPVRGPLAARLAFADRVVERVEQIPGVESAAVTTLVPLGGDALVASFHPAGRSDIPGTRPSTLSVGPRYFETLSIPLVQGREFAPTDRDGAPAVAIVNQTFAKTYFPGRPALSTVEGPALSTVEGPALSTVEGPALSTVEGPALSTAEGPALSTVEGPALSTVEGPALSTAEGPALSTAEGPALSTAEGPALSTVEGPALSTVEGPALSTVEGPALSTVEGPALSTAEGRALGQRIEIGGESDALIVGVVRDSRIDTIGEAPKSVVFYPYAQRPRRLTVIARTAGDPAATLPAFRAAIGELDAGASVTVSTLRDAAGTELNMRRVGTQMIGTIGILGVLLTAVGLYGVVSYFVASRTAELGIRMALGATPRRLHLEVLRHAARLVGGGIAIGIAASLLVTPALATFLAGLSPADPIAFVAAAAVLMLVACGASYLPARRVARVDPVLALRE